MSEIKRMSVKAFRAQGYLQELNRRFLHPLGLAIEVVVDDEDGTMSFGGVWDYRDDPEGIRFDYADKGFSPPDRVNRARENMDWIAVQEMERKPTREAALGFWIEPIPCKEGGE